MVAKSIEKDQEATANLQTTATLDEAMALTGLGAYNLLHMLMTGLILTGVIMQSLMLGYVMPAAQCDLNLSLQQRGWLAAIPFIAIILTSHMWGYLADTRGRRPVMQYSMALSVLFSVISSFSPNLASFAVLQFLSSIFMSGTSAVAYAYLGEFNNLRHRDKMVAFGSSFIGIGTVILPAISWLIFSFDFSYDLPLLGISYRPWRLLVVACAIPYAVSTLLMFFAPESPKFLNAKSRTVECLEIVKKMYSVNKWKPADSFPVKTLVCENNEASDTERKGAVGVLISMRDQTVPLFKLPLLPWTCLACFVQFGILAATNGFYVWFPTILNSIANHDSGPASICEILDAAKPSGNETEGVCDDSMSNDTFQRSIYIGLVFCSVYIIVGFLVDYLGKKLILIVVIGGAGLCGICAHLASDQKVGIVLFAIFQMSGACIGLMNAVAVELFPTKLRAMAVCLAMMMGRVGSVFGSNLIGVFLDINCGAGFYLFGGLLIVCSIFCFTLPGKKQKSSSPVKETLADPKLNETHEPA